MALRIPPGRAGQSGLVGLLEIARRDAELLDRKRQALLREQARVRGEAASARCAWHEAAENAALWMTRAAMLDGAGRLELLARHVDAQASLELSWSNLMGARLPTAEQISIPDPPALSALGGSSATVIAARACCEATRTAASRSDATRADLAAARKRPAAPGPDCFGPGAVGVFVSGVWVPPDEVMGAVCEDRWQVRQILANTNSTNRAEAVRPGTQWVWRGPTLRLQ